MWSRGEEDSILRYAQDIEIVANLLELGARADGTKKMRNTARLQQLAELVESFRRTQHYYVDEDCWFSCPAHPEYCGDRERVCGCGLTEHNGRIDGALELIAMIEAYL